MTYQTECAAAAASQMGIHGRQVDVILTGPELVDAVALRTDCGFMARAGR
ncbi:hypothetical protein [Paracoccus subflavus]|nr:hypothetical protein [Paracoccus subflavus]